MGKGFEVTPQQMHEWAVRHQLGIEYNFPRKMKERQVEESRQFESEAYEVLIKLLSARTITTDDLYYSGKLINSIAGYGFVNRDAHLASREGTDNGELRIIDLPVDEVLEQFDHYYLCVEFDDGRHIPIPVLMESVRDHIYDHRPSAQSQIAYLALRHYRKLRQLALQVAIYRARKQVEGKLYEGFIPRKPDYDRDWDEFDAV